MPDRATHRAAATRRRGLATTLDPHDDLPRLSRDARAAKQALRERIRAERRSRDTSARNEVDKALAAVLMEMPEVRKARCATIYASTAGEPGTQEARMALRDLGVRVLLPFVTADLDLDWGVDSGETTPVKGIGGPVPVGPRLGRSAIGEADVVVVPALAVDTLGNRLGQGGGCYDKALRRVDPSALVVALLHDEELLDAAVEPMPCEPHDRRVAAVVTPTRWMHLEPQQVGPHA